jgi:hypothetical protein
MQILKGVSKVALFHSAPCNCHTLRCLKQKIVTIELKILTFNKENFVVITSVFCCYYKCILLLLQVYFVVIISVFCCYYKCILLLLEVYFVVITSVFCSTLFMESVTLYCDNDKSTHNCRFKVQHF